MSRPFSPSRITSSTGGVREPTTRQPADIASSSDQDSTNGIRQVDVHRRAAQQRQVVGVRNAPGEVHARKIDLAVDLAQQALAVGLARRQARRVAHLVAADDHDARLRPALLDLGNRAHEDVEAAVGLEVARDVSDQLLLTRPFDGRTTSVSMPSWITLMRARVRGRELLLLPARRRHAPVGGVERHEERRVHHAQAQDLLGVDRKFRVEADVAALRAVEELAVEQHPRVRGRCP